MAIALRNDLSVTATAPAPGDGGDGDGAPQTYAETTGPDGITYVVEALPSGVIGWQYEASAFDFGPIGALAGGVSNLVGRVVFRFGWQLKVTRQSARWPHWSKVVARRRFRKKQNALAGFSQLVEDIHTHGPVMVRDRPNCAQRQAIPHR